MKQSAGKIIEKVVVITGASRGFGQAMARLFAQEGARVVLSARSAEGIQRIATDLISQGKKADAIKCDVTDPSQIEELARSVIELHGHFDIWINNAGIAGPYGSSLDLSPQAFEEVIKTNILGVYHGSRTALRHFLPRGHGKLINILGAGERKPVPNQNAYASSKTWIRNFTLALAAEYKDKGVGIHVLQPGLMNTDLLSRITTFPSYADRLRNFMPLLIKAGSRSPEISAQKAVWLASSATDRKTGLEIRMDSRPRLLAGFLKEGWRRLLHLPREIVEIKLDVIPSSFEPL